MRRIKTDPDKTNKRNKNRITTRPHIAGVERNTTLVEYDQVGSMPLGVAQQMSTKRVKGMNLKGLVCVRVIDSFWAIID